MLTDLQKYMLHYVAKNESKDKFDAITKNDAGTGLAYGFLQFNQKRGTLNLLFKRMHEKDSETFAEMFWWDHGQLWINTDIKEVDDLWDRDKLIKLDLTEYWFVTALKDAGKHKPFQEAQEELGYLEYLRPVEDMIRGTHGVLTSERAYLILLDSAIQNGPGATRSFLKTALASPQGNESETAILTEIATLADDNKWANKRRTKILRDTFVSDHPPGFSATTVSNARRILKFGMEGQDVKNLQHVLMSLHMLIIPTDVNIVSEWEKFGMKTLTAVKDFQKHFGLVNDGVVGPESFKVLDIIEKSLELVKEQHNE